MNKKRESTRGMTDSQRFNHYTDKFGDCWVWTGPTTRGYGDMRSTGGRIYAHRFSYEKHNGVKLQDGQNVLHSCDNPPCVNPDHLFIGSQQDNMADCKNKKRNAHGERAGAAKLSEADVITIRQLCRDGLTNLEIAETFGMHRSTISNIKCRVIWKHLP